MFLAGTFNGWSQKLTPMTKDAEGNWSVAVDLKPDKFVVDGAWCCGPGHDGDHPGRRECVPNSFGTKNRFIEVT